MFIKAMLSNGLFRIYEDVTDVIMSPPDRDYGLLSRLDTGEVVINRENLITLIEDVSDVIDLQDMTEEGEPFYEGYEYEGAKEILLLNPKNEGLESRAVFFIDGDEHTILISQNRLYLCNNDGTTMAK